MTNGSPTPRGIACSLLLGAVSLALVACATLPSYEPEYDFFAQVERERNPWFSQVAEWQERARRDHPYVVIDEVRGAESTKLREQVRDFHTEHRLSLAKTISAWVLAEGRRHYVSDDEPANDYWPTYSELVDANGDDCDGLDLLAYQLLREFGFPKDQLFRAILMRNRDDANHMVTLWFEDPDDPWVFDGTGATTREFVRLSEVEGWTPTNVFNEKAQFLVVKRGDGKLAALRSKDSFLSDSD